jgi:glycosyltransferase involved in cell wall biosynthesis
MVKEKILLMADSLNAPTGFSTSLGGVAWSLADKYEVHALGLQTFQDHKVDLNLNGEKRTVFQHANQPRSNDRWDFGQRSLPRLMDELEPDIFITVNDIQMVQHVPDVMCKSNIKLQVIDLPSKQFLSDEAMRLQLQGELQKFKEKFPRTTKWIQYAPEDGHPPMPQWGNIYKMSDQVVAFSKYGQWVFKEWFGMDVPRIYHGVDTDVFKPMGKPKGFEDKFVVGSFNRNQPRKQPVRTMMAFAKFAKDKPDVLLHMQMDWNDEFGWPLQYFGELYGIMNKMIQPARVGIPTPEVAKIYNMWDLNLNCTGGEGFNLCVIEGFACGIPSIGVPYTTYQELTIDGEPSPRGSLAKIKDMHWQKLDVAAVQRSLVDVDDLSNVMNKYYFNRDLVIQHGKNARLWTEKNCSWKIIQNQWKDLVGKVLAGEKVSNIEVR